MSSAGAAQAEATAEFRIKFVSAAHEPDITVSVRRSDTVGVLLQRVREAHRVPVGKHLRVLCGGKELYADDPVAKASAHVLHCMLSDTQPQRPPPAPVERKDVQQPPPPPPVEQPPVDWLDVVDPGTVLMWIFGSILALLWLLFCFYAHMFDRTSVIMLVMMTVAFLVPCVLSYVPWPTFLQHTAIRAPGAVGGAGGPPHGGGYDPARGASTAVAGQAAWQRHPYGGDVPPRPPARVRPADS